MCNNLYSDEPTPQTLYHFIEYTWKDIHHSRLQNWTGITIVTAFHIGILKATEFLFNKQLFNMSIKINLFIFGAFFCLIGFLITYKHQKQMYKRLKWNKNAETMLNIID